MLSHKQNVIPGENRLIFNKVLVCGEGYTTAGLAFVTCFPFCFAFCRVTLRICCFYFGQVLLTTSQMKPLTAATAVARAYATDADTDGA